MSKSVGKYLLRARENSGIPQSIAASILNISQSSLSKYENDILEPNIKVLKALAKLYKISLDSLTGFSYECSRKNIEKFNIDILKNLQ